MTVVGGMVFTKIRNIGAWAALGTRESVLLSLRCLVDVMRLFDAHSKSPL